jgi:hypothetical protein
MKWFFRLAGERVAQDTLSPATKSLEYQFCFGNKRRLSPNSQESQQVPDEIG